MVSVENAGIRLAMTEENREVLATITEVQTMFNVVLGAVGKICTASNHAVFANAPVAADDVVTYAVLVQRPETLRNIVNDLANEATPGASRQYHIAHNSISGARFNAENLLVNADQIYPADSNNAELINDVREYKNLITRIQNRLPNALFH